MASNAATAATAGTLKMLSNFPRMLGQRLNRAFKKNLFVSNVLISSGLFGTADGIEQMLEIKVFKVRSEWDSRRTMRMMVCGLLIAPFDHVWYTIVLDRILPANRLRSTVIRKIIADQLVASPLMSLLFFMAMGTMEGRTAKSSADEFVNKFPAVYAADWCFWPAAQYINFRYLPREYRVIYVNSCVTVWYSFLSYMKHQHDPKKNKTMTSTENDVNSKLTPATFQTTTAAAADDVIGLSSSLHSLLRPDQIIMNADLSANNSSSI